MFCAVCCCVLPGWLFDVYHSYSISFYIGGASILISGLVIMLLAAAISDLCHQQCVVVVI